MVRKKVLNKRTMIIASSLVVIPLTAMLIAAAAAARRERRKSLQTSEFLGQSRLKRSVITTAANTRSQQQEEKSQAQLESPWQGSEIEKTAAATTTRPATTISTKTIVDDKDVITPAKVLSPKVPSSTSDSAVIIFSSSSSSSPPQTPKEEEISVSDEAKKAGESLKELIVTAIKEAKDSAKGTGKQLKEQTIDIATTADSKDIQYLGDNVSALVGLFEEMIIEIRKEHYNEQIKLLEGYKDLLQTHIKVVNARGKMASKLKPGA
jgi:hypothetical protein